MAHDHAVTAKELLKLSGLEAIQGMIEGRFPPPSITTTLGYRLVEAEEGRAVFVGEPSERLMNPLGVVHGGWALTLIDSATGVAAHTTLAAGVGYTTVETKVNFVRAILPTTGEVRVEGKVVARGRTIITAEARLTNSHGKLLAHGSSTLMVLRQEKSA